MTDLPILWSFRRCPYAMRARLGLRKAGVTVEKREILLKDKPAEFLRASKSATVPTLETGNEVLDESLDIMVWALKQSDPEQLLNMPEVGWALIEENDGPFKMALDHTKYAVRYPELDPARERSDASDFIFQLEDRLKGQAWLFGSEPRIADFALLPFVRQFANTDSAWFHAQPWPSVIGWLKAFVDGEDFAQIMQKHAVWDNRGGGVQDAMDP